MSVTITSLFDRTNNRFDPVVFDTKLQYLVEIDGAKTLFDTALFSDPPFDTSRGDIITFTDSAAQSLQSQRSISTSISLSDTPTRVLASLRSITASSISLSDSLARVTGGIRNISQSISIGETLSKITPTVNRYVYDLGALFDNIFFSSPPFDTSIQSHQITDSVARSDINKESITEPSISLSDSAARIYNSIRNMTESTISLSDSVSRLFKSFRTVTQSVASSDNLSGLATTFRSITAAAITLADSVVSPKGNFRSLSQSVSISETIAGGKLILIPIRNTVQFIKELRNTTQFVKATRATRQFIQTVRKNVTL